MATKTAKAGNILKVKALPSTNGNSKKSNIPDDFNLPKSFNKSPDEFKFIPRYKIHPSPTNPRKRLDPVTINELAGSIKEKGMLEPLLVRINYSAPPEIQKAYDTAKENLDKSKKIYDEDSTEFNSKAFSKNQEKFANAERKLRNSKVEEGYELVCGERRWRAADIAKLEIVPVIIKDLTGAEVLDIQIHENLHREDVHPMDEALGYKYLMETVGLSLTDLALKVGKTEAFVHQRLKLNDLSPVVQMEFTDGFLPIGHAMEIAKYPAEVQTEILNKHCYYDSWSVDKKTVRPLNKLRENIERHVHLNLKQAPFSLKSVELHPQGLACVDCKERTGASSTLFDFEEGTDKDDRCLNKICFGKKIETQITIQQFKASEPVIKETDDTSYNAPLISTRWDGKNETFHAIGSQEYTEIKTKKDNCPHAETGVFVDGNRITQTQLICRDINCPKHGKTNEVNQTATSQQNNAEAQEKRRIRKEEIFDIKIAAKVRYRVLKECATKFEGLKGMELENLQTMVQRLFDLQYSKDSTVLEVFAPFLAKIIGIDEKEGTYLAHEVSRALLSGHSLANKNKIPDLSFDDLRKIAFLLFYGHLNPIYYLDKRSTPYVSDRYSSQKLIKEMAEEYQVDWKRFDAEERLSLAPMKEKEPFRAHLHQLEAGNYDSIIPRIWSTKWKPKD